MFFRKDITMNFNEIANEIIESHDYQKITFDSRERSLWIDQDNVKIKINNNSITVLPNTRIKNTEFC